MMVVREGCEVGYVEGDRVHSCSWGGETEARLYYSGAPQAVNINEDCLDIAPTPQVSEELTGPALSLGGRCFWGHAQGCQRIALWGTVSLVQQYCGSRAVLMVLCSLCPGATGLLLCADCVGVYSWALTVWVWVCRRCRRRRWWTGRGT